MHSPSALRVVPLDQVRPGDNARAELGDIGGLAASIAAIGLQKPLIVHQAPDGQYDVLDGHRRLAAMQRLRRPDVEVIVRAGTPTTTSRVLGQLAMHTHAAPFDPVSEALAIHRLMWTGDRLSRDQIAHLLGRSPQWVADRLGLLQLSEAEQRAITTGRMSLAEARLRVQTIRAERAGRPAVAVPAQRAATPRSPAPVDARHCPSCSCEPVGAVTT